MTEVTESIAQNDYPDMSIQASLKQSAKHNNSLMMRMPKYPKATIESRDNPRSMS